MIISNSHNFVFLRVPKVASTSVTTAIYDSDLVSLGKDFCPGIEHEYFAKDDRSHKGRLAINGQLFANTARRNQTFSWESWWPWPKSNPMFFAHATYNQMVEMNLIKNDIPSFATIRNPVDRFLSVWSFLFHGLRTMNPANQAVFDNAPPELAKLLNLDPNEFHDVFFNLKIDGYLKKTPLVFLDLFRKPQTYWGTKNTEYWPIESLNSSLNKLFEIKGVQTHLVQHHKKDRNTSKRTLLTPDRQINIINNFEVDYSLWESLQQ